MQDPELERLFARFALEGDAAALGEVFDRVAPELLAVAGHLARDAAQAEDLVQATFLAAIESARRYDRARPLVPWLVGILTRQTRYAARRDGRRPAPERLTWRESREPREASEGREFADALKDALTRLPRLYRDVLEAHLHDGQSSREIAVRTGRPAGTVRVQLHRGFDLLRQALPAGFALGAAATVVPTRGLAAVRADVLAAAETRSGGLLAALAGGTLATVLALAAGLALVVGGTWFGLTRLGADDEPADAIGADTTAALARREPPPEPERLTSSESSTPLASGVRAARENVADARADDADAAPGTVVMDALDVRWLVDARVTGPDVVDGAPAEVTVRLVGSESAVSASVDADGYARLDITELVEGSRAYPPSLVIEAEHEEFVPERGELDVTRSSPSGPDERVVRAGTLRLRRVFAHVEGRLRSGAWPASVALFAVESGEPLPQPIDEAEILGGRYRLRVAERGQYLVVAEHPERRPASELVDVDAAGRLTLRDLELEAGRTLEGEVVLPDGEPALGGEVVATPHALLEDERRRRKGDTRSFAWHGLGWAEGRVLRRAAAAPIEPNGGFTLRGLDDVEYAVAARGLAGLPIDADYVDIVSAHETVARIVPPIGLVQVEVRGSDGPLAGATVEIVLERGRGGQTLVTDSDGRARIFGPADLGADLRVSAHGHESVERTLSFPSAGMSLRSVVLLPEREPGAVTLVLAWRADFPAPPTLRVQELTRGVRGAVRLIVRAEDGTYPLDGLAAGERAFVVSPAPGELLFVPVPVSGTLPEEGALELALRPQRGGRVRFVVLDSFDANFAVEVQDEHGWHALEVIERARARSLDVTLELPVLPVGRHALRIVGSRSRGTWSGTVDVEAGPEPSTVHVSIASGARRKRRR